MMNAKQRAIADQNLASLSEMVSTYFKSLRRLDVPESAATLLAGGFQAIILLQSLERGKNDE